METSEEGMFGIYSSKKELIAVVKRDDVSGKHLVYLVKEATSSEIVELIKNNNKQ